ncbi:hypothetical protein GCM10023347_07520 [Streptomyces chumphonensis]
METGSTHLNVNGQEFVARARPDEPGVYDFEWVNGPYGFSSATSDCSVMDHKALEDSVREFLNSFESDV